MFRLRLLFVLAITACAARVDDAVRLVYTPEVGRSYRYEVEIEKGLEATVVRHVEARTSDGFKERHHLIKSGEEEDVTFQVSTRYTSDDHRFVDLDFPTEAVRAGDAWPGRLAERKTYSQHIDFSWELRLVDDQTAAL